MTRPHCLPVRVPRPVEEVPVLCCQAQTRLHGRQQTRHKRGFAPREWESPQPERSKAPRLWCTETTARPSWTVHTNAAWSMPAARRLLPCSCTPTSAACWSARARAAFATASDVSSLQQGGRSHHRGEPVPELGTAPPRDDVHSVAGVGTQAPQHPQHLLIGAGIRLGVVHARLAVGGERAVIVKQEEALACPAFAQSQKLLTDAPGHGCTFAPARLFIPSLRRNMSSMSLVGMLLDVISLHSLTSPKGLLP